MRRQYAGAAFSSVLTTELAASTSGLTIYCNDLTNWPDGSIGPFYIVIDRGLASEEKILCVSRTANILAVYNDGVTNGRGADGTSVQAHGINAVIEHVFTATDANEANLHVNDSTTDVHPQYIMESVVTAKGDLLVATASGVVDNLPVGANQTVLVADSASAAGVKWDTVSSGGDFPSFFLMGA